MKHTDVVRRDEAFVGQAGTRIWQEIPSAKNPYLARACRCHGYDLFALMERISYPEMLYLLFKGELPHESDVCLLQDMMVAMANPGPRHPATRAAMMAGVGKTNPLHILPIGLSVLGGDWQGAGVVEASMRFLVKNKRRQPEAVAGEWLEPAGGHGTEPGERGIVPGFGTHFGDVDPLAAEMARRLSDRHKDAQSLRWGNDFARRLNEVGQGWLMPGLAAAVFVDLGFKPRSGGGLFQLLQAPGLLAHGLEQANKPMTAMPFVDDEHYVIED